MLTLSYLWLPYMILPMYAGLDGRTEPFTCTTYQEWTQAGQSGASLLCTATAAHQHGRPEEQPES